jgi:cytochrome P450
MVPIPLPDHQVDPYPHYETLRAAAPVHRAELPDGTAVWLVTRHADVRSALGDRRLSNDPQYAEAAFGDGPARWRPENLHNMLRTDPPRHTRLRRLTAEAFTARRVERLRPRVEEITGGLLDALSAAGAGPVDLIDGLAFPLPIGVICELLGVPAADRDAFRRWTEAILAYPTDPGAATAMDAARDGIRDYLTALIAAKRERPADDLLSALIATRDADPGSTASPSTAANPAAAGEAGGPGGNQPGGEAGGPGGGSREGGLDDLELLSTASLLLTAGHETTVNLIGNGVLALLRHPDQLAAVRADPTLLPAAVEELLRYDSPIVPGIMKFAATDLELAGTPIPRGDVVLLAVGPANRDPGRLADPHRLDVTRPANPHLSFGHGIHFCIGAALARMEAQIAIGALLRRFSRLALAVPVDRLRWRPSFLRGLVELPVLLGSVGRASWPGPGDSCDGEQEHHLYDDPEDVVNPGFAGDRHARGDHVEQADNDVGRSVDPCPGEE